MPCFINTFQWQQKGVVSECNLAYKVKQKMNFSLWESVRVSMTIGSQPLESRKPVQGSIKLPQKRKQFSSLNCNRSEGGFYMTRRLFKSCFVKDNFRAVIMLC